MLNVCGFLLFRMDWTKLMAHPFWTQILNEEEDAEEEVEEEEDGERLHKGANICQQVGSASLRYVDICYYFFWFYSSYCIDLYIHNIYSSMLLHLLLIHLTAHSFTLWKIRNVHITGRCRSVVQAQSSLF